MTIHRGEVHAIIGGNGAGKTTLARLLVGLLKPTEGRILIDGLDTRTQKVADLASTIGTAFQNPDEQITEKTVAAEIGFPLQRRRYQKTGWFTKRLRYDAAYIQERTAQACDLVGLGEELLVRDPSLLSRGQRRLVTIAEALALDPSVLILDEPMVGLDAASRRQVSRMIERLREMARAVILVEHDMDLVCALADAVTVLNGGRVTAQGATRTVFTGDRWDLLEGISLKPPHAAQLGQTIGVPALTDEELIEKLSANRSDGGPQRSFPPISKEL